MFYADDSGELYFSLNSLLAGQSNVNIYYVFYLNNVSIKPINNVNEFIKPIRERSNMTKICKSDLKQCLQYYGHFTWTLTLI